MKEPIFKEILDKKTDYYGHTEAAYEFAAEEFALELVAYNELKKIEDARYQLLDVKIRQSKKGVPKMKNPPPPPSAPTEKQILQWENRALREALQYLVDTKKRKDEIGKDSIYMSRQRLGWMKANSLLNPSDDE